MVVAALQPWAEISERLRRFVYKIECEALPPFPITGFEMYLIEMIVFYLNLESMTTNRER